MSAQRKAKLQAAYEAIISEAIQGLIAVCEDEQTGYNNWPHDSADLIEARTADLRDV